MPTSLIIVDDFLDNANELRQAALGLSYPEQSGMFPGRNSVQRVAINGLSQQVSKLVGEPLEAMPPPQAHSKCRISLAGDQRKGNVHVDAAHWSGILYLSRPQDCQGGTEFFRHRRTGTDRAPYNDAEAAQYGYASAKQMVDAILDHESLDESCWELTMRVPMRFNRLILLRPWLWHTAGDSFGDSLENGRLVYLMFFASPQR